MDLVGVVRRQPKLTLAIGLCVVIFGAWCALTSGSSDDDRLDALRKRLVACGVSDQFVMDEIHSIGKADDGGTFYALPLDGGTSLDDALEITVGETPDEGFVMYGSIDNPIAQACGGTDEWFYAQPQQSDK
ncbi:hypothetical protein ACIPK5_30435 [Streptomyces sp. NPDC086843]|uniref:hypothetical protein n=1 Tax=Streptomyces sp. NPDC086843 TaxID=3365763 RepID=UPI0038162E65